jgi:hypothetical protein
MVNWLYKILSARMPWVTTLKQVEERGGLALDGRTSECDGNIATKKLPFEIEWNADRLVHQLHARD